MRLKSINVYSDYLGDSEKTKLRTEELRADSDFLDCVFLHEIKYIDNMYLRQLNVCCSSPAQEICVRSELSEGYPEIVIPFDYSGYAAMEEKGKDLFWVNTIEKVFHFLEPRMRCKDNKLATYITCLRECEISLYKQQVKESYKVWRKVCGIEEQNG